MPPQVLMAFELTAAGHRRQSVDQGLEHSRVWRLSSAWSARRGRPPRADRPVWESTVPEMANVLARRGESLSSSVLVLNPPSLVLLAAQKQPFTIGRGRLKARLRLEGSRLKRPFAIGRGWPVLPARPFAIGRAASAFPKTPLAIGDVQTCTLIMSSLLQTKCLGTSFQNNCAATILLGPHGVRTDRPEQNDHSRWICPASPLPTPNRRSLRLSDQFLKPE
jgi:hypothetical protein